MEKYLEIIEVHGREILDSRGNPTVAPDSSRLWNSGTVRPDISAWACSMP